MSYTCTQVDDLEKTAMVGNHQCVALVRHYGGAPATLAWKQGEAVLGNRLLRKGTAIATFVNGKYANQQHGNHAALYMGQALDGILVMDQWKDKRQALVDDSVSQCEFTYRKGRKAGQNEIDIDCR